MQLKTKKTFLSLLLLALCLILSSCSYIGTPLFLQNNDKIHTNNNTSKNLNHENISQSQITNTPQLQNTDIDNFIELSSTTNKEKHTKQSGIYQEENTQIIKDKSILYTYTIEPNDTLYSIATLSNTSVANLKYINNITDPTQIEIGKIINVTRPISEKKLHDRKANIANTKKSKSPSSPKKIKPKVKAKKIHKKKTKDPSWVWPIKGKVSQKYNPNGIGGKGVRISAPKNTSVRASKEGIIAYSGNNIKGYGSVVIIKHSNDLISIYGFLNKSIVKKGQKIAKKQQIGTVGIAPNKKSLLHFEIHKNGKHTDPFKYISKRKYL